jgi:Ca-activated chloride channel family protein
MDNRRYRIPILTSFAFFFALMWISRISAQERSSITPGATIKIDVDLVLLTATVTGLDGRTVTGLQQKHFRLWEDKVEQQIEYLTEEDTPVSIGLIFDATGSMADKITAARDAAATFLRASNPEDEFFLVTFSQEPRFVEFFTTDISRLQNRMLFTGTKGLTPLFDAVYLGLDKMKSAANKRKALLLITDGEDNHSRYSLTDVKQFVREQDVQIFAIGIVDSSQQLVEGRTGRATIEDLVNATGGHAFFPESADELEDICSKIAIELRNEYVLGYHPTNKTTDGLWRKIRVKVDPPKGFTGLSVHARNGYYAPNLNPKSHEKGTKQ